MEYLLLEQVTVFLVLCCVLVRCVDFVLHLEILSLVVEIERSSVNLVKF